MCYSICMALSFSQVQRISQKQSLKLSQIQIQSLNLLSLNSADFRSAIYTEVEKNPALEITRDSFEDGIETVSKSSGGLSDYTHISKAGRAEDDKSQAFQNVLESQADDRESLSEHLEFQLRTSKLTESQKTLGTKLIHNLDKDGFHILAPVSFLNLDENIPQDLEICLHTIQNLDPCGTCCANIGESLLVQARAQDEVPPAALFILETDLNFLYPPQPQKVLAKIKDYAAAESKKAFNTKDFSFVQNFTEDDIEDAIAFIKTLDPKPARDYSQNENSYIVPEVYVEKIPLVTNPEKMDDAFINGTGEGAHSFLIRTAQGLIPDVVVSKEYIDLAKEKSLPEEQKKKLSESVTNAKQFIDIIKYREQSIMTAACAIVERQTEFFEKGPGHLVPLTQRELAPILEVTESTVSRMANNKFLQCEWGIFPLKYFFTTGVVQEKPKLPPDATGIDIENGVNFSSGISQASTTSAAPDSNETPDVVSKDKILFEIKQILDSQPAGAKKLSDQKLSDMLAARGIKVARRTIAKYRSQANIESSYNR